MKVVLELHKELYALPLIHKVYPFVSLSLSSCWTLVMKCVATVPFISMALLIWELEIQKPFESISLFFSCKILESSM